jgi:hypothetical protein
MERFLSSDILQKLDDVNRESSSPLENVCAESLRDFRLLVAQNTRHEITNVRQIKRP